MHERRDVTHRHPDRDLFLKMCQDKIWKKFKASVTFVKDHRLKLGMQKFIDATADQFSAEVWYHDSCRKKYILSLFTMLSKADEGNLQNVNEKDIEQNFINYINDN